MTPGSALADVIEFWRRAGLRPLPGLDRSKIDAFEILYDVTLPDDMRLFYSATNGVQSPHCRGDIRTDVEFYRLRDVVRDDITTWAWNFADYMMLSWWFAIDLTGEGPFEPGAVYMIGGGPPQPLCIARSFTEFLELYLAQDERLVPRGAIAHDESIRPAPERNAVRARARTR